MSYVLLEMLQDARKARGYGLFCFVGILSSPTFLYGRGEETRTPDILLPKQARYQLRYTSIPTRFRAARTIISKKRDNCNSQFFVSDYNPIKTKNCRKIGQLFTLGIIPTPRETPSRATDKFIRQHRDHCKNNQNHQKRARNQYRSQCQRTNRFPYRLAPFFGCRLVSVILIDVIQEFSALLTHTPLIVFNAAIRTFHDLNQTFPFPSGGKLRRIILYL